MTFIKLKLTPIHNVGKLQKKKKKKNTGAEPTTTFCAPENFVLHCVPSFMCIITNAYAADPRPQVIAAYRSLLVSLSSSLKLERTRDSRG